MNEHKNIESTEMVILEDTTVALCNKKESEEEITQATATNSVETSTEKTTDTLPHEAIFEVPPTEIAFFGNLKYKVRVGVGANKSVLYFTTCLVDTGAKPNLNNESV